jgi:hypothetical protein
MLRSDSPSCFSEEWSWRVVLFVALAAGASFLFYGLGGPMLRSDPLVRPVFRSAGSLMLLQNPLVFCTPVRLFAA